MRSSPHADFNSFLYSHERRHGNEERKGILRYAIAAVVLAALMFIGVASAWTPTRDAVIDRRHNVNDIRQGKCIEVIPTHFLPFNSAAAFLERKWATWGRFKERSKARNSKCGPDLMGWYYNSGAKCVHEHEGAWTSNTGNGYYGGFQADLSFASTYGPEYYPPTPDQWTPLQQIHMAYRGWLARGWYPWPNTARACGLL